MTGIVGCSRSEWQTRGDYIAFPGGPCVASLTYTLRLDKPGSLHYTYQYPDDDAIFEFQAQNEMCQSVASNDDTRWPAVTEEGKWHSKTIELPEGLNVLQWKAMGISGRQTKPLLIKLIQVCLATLANPAWPSDSSNPLLADEVNFDREPSIQRYKAKAKPSVLLFQNAGWRTKYRFIVTETSPRVAWYIY